MGSVNFGRRCKKLYSKRINCHTSYKKLFVTVTCIAFVALLFCQVYIGKKSFQFYGPPPWEQQTLQGFNSSFIQFLPKWIIGARTRVPLPTGIKNGSLENLQKLERIKPKNESQYLELILSRFYKAQKSHVFKSPISFSELLKFWVSSQEPPKEQEVTFTLNHPQICSDHGAGLPLLIAVTSSASHVESRAAIRDTWGGFAMEKGVKLVFFIGIPKHPKYHARLAAEDIEFHDMVQGNFLDTYTNLSIKSVSMLKWVLEFCPLVKYILKVDDDMFINVDRFLEITHSRNASMAIVGELAHKWSPVRSNKNKWYASYKDYPFNIYPDFVFGPSYLLTGDSVQVLYETSQRVKLFRLEDVYITGLLAELSNVKRFNQTGMFNVPKDLQPCNYQKLLSSHGHTAPDMYRHWMWLRRRSFKCVN